MAVKDWSTTAGSNTGILSGLTLDGAVMTPPQVDNAFRDMAAQIASQLGKTGFKGADIASAGTTNLANATGWFCDVTGTTTITAFGTVDAGQMFMLRFTGVLLLTYNASSLILPGAASKTTAANDVAIMLSLGSGNWQCVSYQQAVTTSLTITPPTQQTFIANGTWTKPTGCTRAEFVGVGGGGAGGNVDGQSGTAGGAGGGGGSGFYGTTGILDVSAVVSAAVTIGAAGAVSGSASGDGGTGGNTAITIGATTYTWGAGIGGGGMIASTTAGGTQDGGAGGTGINLYGGGAPGEMGAYNANGATNGTGGNGASNPLGGGGKGQHLISATAAGGLAATGNGSGGAGAIVIGVTTNSTGSAGRIGILRVTEYYS